MQSTSTILIADEDRKTRDLVSAYLTYQGYNIAVQENETSIFDTIRRDNVTIVIADFDYLFKTHQNFNKSALELNPYLVIIGYGSNTQKDHAAVIGDEHVFTLPRPVNLDELESLVMRAREYQTMKLQESTGEDAAHHKIISSTMIGKSKPMKSLFDLIGKVAESTATVLIQGESGTGKELAARAIHLLSKRNGKNFIPVNCAAIPDDLLESELFGHVKGSFTGAHSNRAGRFEMADKGTLFLDEIGDMKANLQVKLLRVLQNKEFEPVGASKSQKADVRIIAATNKNLEELVVSHDFREDLYYRLSVIPITIPPLRERCEDIPLLIHTFLSRFNSDRRHAVKGFSKECMEMLCNYSWPGNVRELENLVERLVILKDSGFLTVDDLPDKYITGIASGHTKTCLPTSDEQLPEFGICLNSAVDEFENRLIMQALTRTCGNKKEAAKLLNLKRTTLIEKLKKKNISYGCEE